MASKKYITLIACMFVLFQTYSYAQSSTDYGWDWKDSSKVATKHIPQYNEFLNNQYPYPARPRDQWELGIFAGHTFIIGDVPLTFSSQDVTGFSRGANVGGFVVGASLRKSLNHTFSLRASGFYSSDHIAHYVNPGAGINKPNMDANTTIGGSLDLLASLNSASYYRANPKVNVYVLGGYSLMSAKVKKSGGALFTNVTLNNLISGSGSLTDGGSTLNMLYHAVDFGGGVAFKLSNKVNLALEEKVIAPMFGNDFLDGVRGGNSGDITNQATVRLNINLGNPAKRVQPLWWLNPNNFAYSELNSPKHMKMPKVVLPDADGDGVTDQFDLEPNTPAGAPVDTHGRALDTDGDGVPDYRDKELLTPANCFPVNNDGVGTCPESPCCKELRDQIANMKAVAAACSISDLPSIQFKSGVKLTKDAQKLLDDAATKINENPACKVKVIGHPAASKAAQQMSYERVSAVIKYLVEKRGIAENRFIFNYDGGSGDANTIDLQGTTEDGPNTVPAPHPNLRSRK
jgi:OOP family OmpA-OmpF porin